MVANAAAADDFFDTVEISSTALETTDSPWTRRTWLQQKMGYGYRDPGLSFSRQESDLTRVETELYGEFDWRRDSWRLRVAGSVVHDWIPDLAQTDIWSGYNLTREQRDARRWRFETSDTFVAWQDDEWWVRAGYQTLAWGQAETLKVTDVLARRDQRWPGQEDLEELRLPVPALSVNWNNALDLVLLPGMPTDRIPAAFDEFDPYINLRPTNAATQPNIKHNRGDSPGWALRWQWRQPGMDMQFIFADVYSFETAPVSMLLTPQPQHLLSELNLESWRQQILGIAIQRVKGSWLFKTEQAWHKGVNLASSNALTSWPKHDQWRSMVAAEFNGIRDLTVTGELTWNYTHEHTNSLLQDQWQTGQALRVRYALFNERLTLGGLALHLSGGEGSVARVMADWELSDETSISMSVVEYHAHDTDQLLHPYRNNDVVLISLRQGF